LTFHTTGMYSAEHILVYRHYNNVGPLRLTGREVELIEAQDPESGQFIRAQRAKAAEAEAAKRTVNQPVSIVTPPGATWTPDALE
jgi:hypothetical protein